MKSKQFKIIGFISTFVLIVSGCGTIGSNDLSKDCNEVSNLIFKYKNNTQDNSELNSLEYLQGFKVAASGIFPLIQSPEIRTIIQDIANVELKSNDKENSLQLLDIVTKLNSLRVMCKIEF
jgi:hypothetical protein